MNREVTLLMADKVYLASTSPRRIELIHKYIPQYCSEAFMGRAHAFGAESGRNSNVLATKSGKCFGMCDEGFIIGLDTVVYNGKLSVSPGIETKPYESWN